MLEFTRIGRHAQLANPKKLLSSEFGHAAKRVIDTDHEPITSQQSSRNQQQWSASAERWGPLGAKSTSIAPPQQH